MQALSSYNPQGHSTVQAALRAFEDEYRGKGLSAKCYFAERGQFAKFVWPDWPDSLVQGIARRVDAFRAEHPQLRPVEPGSREWDAAFHAWRSDPSSAFAVASAFEKHFGARLLWVESERDARGRIHARCRIENIVQVRTFGPDDPLSSPATSPPDQVEVISMDLWWKDSFAPIPPSISDADHEALRASFCEVFQWASSRIKPVLDRLHDKLKELYGERLRGLYIFGSYARPDAGIQLPENSDLDVALILSDFNNAYEEIKRFGDITYDLSLEHGLVISLVPIREADFREGRTNLARVISSYAIPVK
jgi:predicted nucleotidyltransferase